MCYTPDLNSGQVHYVVLLGKTINSHSTSFIKVYDISQINAKGGGGGLATL